MRLRHLDSLMIRANGKKNKYTGEQQFSIVEGCCFFCCWDALRSPNFCCMGQTNNPIVPPLNNVSYAGWYNQSQHCPCMGKEVLALKSSVTRTQAKQLVGKQIVAMKKDGSRVTGKLLRISGNKLILQRNKGKKVHTKAIIPLVLFDLLAIGTAPYVYGGYPGGGYPGGGYPGCGDGCDTPKPVPYSYGPGPYGPYGGGFF